VGGPAFTAHHDLSGLLEVEVAALIGAMPHERTGS
jgi:hypothetical protein